MNLEQIKQILLNAKIIDAKLTVDECGIWIESVTLDNGYTIDLSGQSDFVYISGVSLPNGKYTTPASEEKQ